MSGVSPIRSSMLPTTRGCEGSGGSAAVAVDIAGGLPAEALMRSPSGKSRTGHATGSKPSSGSGTTPPSSANAAPRPSTKRPPSSTASAHTCGSPDVGAAVVKEPRGARARGDLARLAQRARVGVADPHPRPRRQCQGCRGGCRPCDSRDCPWSKPALPSLGHSDHHQADGLHVRRLGVPSQERADTEVVQLAGRGPGDRGVGHPGRARRPGLLVDAPLPSPSPTRAASPTAAAWACACPAGSRT